MYIYTGELGYDGPLYDGFLHMTDDMLGPSSMHIKYSSYVYDGLCIRRTNFPGPIESVISKFTCIYIYIYIYTYTHTQSSKTVYSILPQSTQLQNGYLAIRRQCLELVRYMLPAALEYPSGD